VWMSLYRRIRCPQERDGEDDQVDGPPQVNAA
jgi:hypothetical protein